MKLALRVLIYAALLIGALVFGRRFMEAYSQQFEAAAHRYDASEPQPAHLDDQTPPIQPETNLTQVPPPTTPPGSSTDTNAIDISTNRVEAPQPSSAAPPTAPTTASSRPAAEKPGGLLGVNAAITLLSVVGLALLVAQDVSRYLSERVHRTLHDDEGRVMVNPEYDQAEQVWANGDYLEAIRLLREFLARNPRQVHVALRIAEIYEKDLSNNLAAALEYEEILQRKLDPERWGWAAIHLCNLYNRIGQAGKAEALLRRIVDEFGETAAAAKARERLGTIEPDAPAAAGAEPLPAEPAAGPKLPPGFRLKKR